MAGSIYAEVVARGFVRVTASGRSKTRPYGKSKAKTGKLNRASALADRPLRLKNRSPRSSPTM